MFNVRKGTKRTLVIFKVPFLIKWMKTNGVSLTKEIFIEELLHGRLWFNASWQNEHSWQKKKINSDLDNIYLISDDLKCNRGNGKFRGEG